MLFTLPPLSRCHRTEIQLVTFTLKIFSYNSPSYQLILRRRCFPLPRLFLISVLFYVSLQCHLETRSFVHYPFRRPSTHFFSPENIHNSCTLTWQFRRTYCLQQKLYIIKYTFNLVSTALITFSLSSFAFFSVVFFDSSSAILQIQNTTFFDEQCAERAIFSAIIGHYRQLPVSKYHTLVPIPYCLN